MALEPHKPQPSALEFKAHLDSLEYDMQALKVRYEQYFLGHERREPSQMRERIQKQLNEMINNMPRNTAIKFKIASLKSRWLSFNRHWDRVLRQIEEGTYRPHLIRAAYREKERLQDGGATAPTVSKGTRGDAVSQLTDEFVKARMKSGEGAAGIDRSKMQKIVDQQTIAIKKKYKCRTVEFKVVTNDGKVKLRAIPKN